MIGIAPVLLCWPRHHSGMDFGSPIPPCRFIPPSAATHHATREACRQGREGSAFAATRLIAAGRSDLLPPGVTAARISRACVCPETRVAQRRGALGGAGSAHAPQAGGAPLRRVLVLAYLGGFRCAESSLFISNIVTLCLPNTFSSLASARI